MGWKLTWTFASGWPFMVTRPDTGTTLPELHPAASGRAMARKVKVPRMGIGPGSWFDDDFTAGDRRHVGEDLHVDRGLDAADGPVAEQEVDDPGVEAPPPVFALCLVAGDLDARIVVIQESGALVVGARQVVQVERIGPERAATEVGARRTLADEQGLAGAIDHARKALGGSGAARPVRVQQAAEARTLLHVDNDLGRVTSPLVEASRTDSAHSAVAAGPELNAVVSAVVGTGLGDEQLIPVDVRWARIG